MKVGELYVIWNDVNDKLYVGITTVGYKRRFRQHLRASHRGHHNYKLYRAIEKYGRDKFYEVFRRKPICFSNGMNPSI